MSNGERATIDCTVDVLRALLIQRPVVAYAVAVPQEARVHIPRNQQCTTDVPKRIMDKLGNEGLQL